MMNNAENFEAQVKRLDPGAEMRTLHMYSDVFQVICRGRIIASDDSPAGAWLKARNHLAPMRLVICTKCIYRYDISDQPIHEFDDGYRGKMREWSCPNCGVKSDTRHWTSHSFTYDHAGAAAMQKLFSLHPEVMFACEPQENAMGWYIKIDGNKVTGFHNSKAEAIEAYLGGYHG